MEHSQIMYTLRGEGVDWALRYMGMRRRGSTERYVTLFFLYVPASAKLFGKCIKLAPNNHKNWFYSLFFVFFFAFFVLFFWPSVTLRGEGSTERYVTWAWEGRGQKKLCNVYIIYECSLICWKQFCSQNKKMKKIQLFVLLNIIWRWGWFMFLY